MQLAEQLVWVVESKKSVGTTRSSPIQTIGLTALGQRTVGLVFRFTSSYRANQGSSIQIRVITMFPICYWFDGSPFIVAFAQFNAGFSYT